MSYTLNIYKDKPRGYWPLEGNLLDFSGNNLTATQTGSISAFGLPMVSSGIASSVITSNVVKFPNRFFRPGYEHDSFALEAWVFAQSNDFDILSHDGQHDGLAMVNGAIRFTIPFVGSEPYIEYVPETKKAIHVVGAYTRWGISLYINGDLFQSLALTEEQQNSAFNPTTDDDFLYAGYGSMLLEAVAIYEYAISPKQVAAHYRAARITAESQQVPQIYGGVRMPIYEPNADTFLSELIGPELSWDLGYMQNTTMSKGRLIQQAVNDVFVEGTWTYAFNVGFAAGTINGVTLGWQGEGHFLVQTSTDNSTWSIAENNQKSPSIAIDTGVTDMILYIKITFPEGDAGYVDYLDITGFRSNEVQPNTRPIVISTTSTIREYADFMEQRLDSGLDLGGGSISIAPATTDYAGTRTFEVLYYSESGSMGVDISSSASFTGIYTNGYPGGDIVAGRWGLVHIVYDGDIGTLTLSGDSIIGHIATYPTALTAQEIAEIGAMYSGRIISEIEGTGTVAISTPEIKIYSNDWSIDSSG